MRATGDKVFALFRHLLLVLFAHGPAKKIGLAQRVTGELAGRRHNLLLVDHYTVSVGTDLFE